VQPAASKEEYLPGAQAAQLPDATAYMPAPQLEQLTLPWPECLPAAQMVQLEPVPLGA